MNSQIIGKARDEYLKYYNSPPRQFNIQRYKDGSWDCEFMDEETMWDKCTLWESNPVTVLDIFFSLDVELINLSRWNEEWDE
jgi:hypothetical protein